MGMQIVDRVLEVVKKDQGILDAFGIQVLKAFDGECVLTCDVPEHLVNAAGFAHGSIVYSMMDTASAYALGSAGVRGVTIHGDVKYIRGGQAGSKLEATVQIKNYTKRTAILSGEVYLLENDERLLAAMGSFVFQLRSDTALGS